jgi:hypothetical protein
MTADINMASVGKISERLPAGNVVSHGRKRRGETDERSAGVYL